MTKSNDIIFEKLELLEQYIYLVPKEGLQIIESIVKTKRPLRPRTKHIKGFGKIKGKSHNDLLIQCVKLLDRIRYFETKKVLELLVGLCQYTQPTVQSNATKALEQLCKYNLFALKQLDFRPQTIVLDRVEKWGRKKLRANFDTFLVISKELLQPSFEGQSNPDYKTLTLHFGPLAVTEELKDIRNRTTELLKNSYSLVDRIDQKTRILSTLQEATQTPHQGGYGEDMEEMVLEDAKTISDFYLSIIPSAENEVVQDIEEQKIWFLRRFGKERLPKISDIEEAIATHKGYSIFRVFVGYDGCLNPDYDFEKDRQVRTKKVNEFVADISDTNFKDWQQKILLVVKNYSGSDLGAYGYFNMFLQELGKNRPTLTLKLITENEKELKYFLLSLIAGIWQSPKPELAKNKISEWLTQNKHLSVCASVFSIVEETDTSLFKKIFWKAKATKDVQTLNIIIRSIVQTYPKSKKLKPLFLDTIKELTKHKDSWWINHVWYKGETILKDLSDEDFEIILENLNLLLSVDYHAEEILIPLAERRPERVINFFHTRVEEKARRKSDVLVDRYDAIPFNLHKLKDVFKKQEKIIVPKILKWFTDGGKKHNWLFRWEASHLLEDIFPDFSPILERELIAITKKKDKKSRDIVFSVLSKYKGSSPHLWNIVYVVVDTYAGSKIYKEVEGHLFGYLSQTGVVTGEYGFRDAYKNKKDALKDLKKKDDNFVKFIENYEKYLEKQISYETKRADEEIELMKRDFD